MPRHFKGVSSLNCPGCGETVDDGTSICPKCDYIIDESFLTGDPEAAPAPKAAAKPRPKKPAGPPGGKPRPARPKPGAAGAGGAAPRRPAAAKARAPEPESEEAASDEESAPPRDTGSTLEAMEQDWRARPAAANQSAQYNAGFITDTLMADLRELFNAMTGPDRMAMVGALITILASFFPWKETVQEAEVIGVVSLGAPCLGAAVVAAAMIVIRVRQVFPRLSPLIPWGLQLLSTAGGTLWALVFIRISWNGTKVPALVGNGMVAISVPSMGAFMGLACLLLALSGTLLGLKEKV